MQQPKKPRLSTRTADWSYTQDRIGQQLKTYYERCITNELPPRLREVLQKLDEESAKQEWTVKGHAAKLPDLLRKVREDSEHR